MKTCIAADIGGTKMLIAEVTAEGKIISKLRFETGGISKEAIMEKLICGVKEYEKQIGWLSGTRPPQIGIGINGIIDPVKGIWKKLGVEDTEVAVVEKIEKELKIRCFIDNDVKCTVMAENQFGAGRKCKNMVYINVGTGLAAGVIANGKVIRGTDGFAGEIGFMNFTDGQGPHVEMLASGMGIRSQAKLLLEKYPDSLLKNRVESGVTGWDVFQAAEQGDAMAAQILDDMVRMNALMISNLTCVLSPEIVVLGGGLISNGTLLKRVQDAVLPKAKQHLERGVVLTGLDPAYAGLMGAATIGLGYQQQYDESKQR
ncbi:MAG: ROK family protein [Lachnospiraceae bacterium]|nr:ROK family protein [Lachnospiraceae bacterium]